MSCTYLVLHPSLNLQVDRGLSSPEEFEAEIGHNVSSLKYSEIERLYILEII